MDSMPLSLTFMLFGIVTGGTATLFASIYSDGDDNRGKDGRAGGTKGGGEGAGEDGGVDEKAKAKDAKGPWSKLGFGKSGDEDGGNGGGDEKDAKGPWYKFGFGKKGGDSKKPSSESQPTADGSKSGVSILGEEAFKKLLEIAQKRDTFVKDINYDSSILPADLVDVVLKRGGGAT